MPKPFHLLVAVFALVGLVVLDGCAKKEPQAVADSSMAADENAQDKPEPLGDDDEGLEVTGLARINFPFDSDAITGNARGILRNNARFMKKNGGLKVLIEGHCDERGTNEYNLALGERRANAVRRYLVDLGIASSRLRTKSFGEERPLEAASSEWAWSQNRRAEFVELK